MKLVVIESPYAGDIEKNKLYLNECIIDSIKRGENPYASHYMLPNFLDDKDHFQRMMGIRMGLQWAAEADYAVFYVDHGMSPGMQSALDHYKAARKKIFIRKLEQESVILKT